jgi:2-polyprenyl-6-methoxyphenol hydroxylase-like FAD-dependent oxidoreductase
MLRREKTEVLVVGAGPVGMYTALLLAERGLRVEIIDEAWRTAAHSYACALHPRTLEQLARLGLSAELLELGRRIERAAFFAGNKRQAEIRFDQISAEFPYVLVLPQSDFEGLLEHQLSRNWGIQVHWNHRLSGFHEEADTVVTRIDQLGGTAKGHIVPRWEVVVQNERECRAEFVLGADGCNSWLRQHLDIAYEPLGESEQFTVFEFDVVGYDANELRMVLDPTTTSFLWPLPSGRCRWSQQVQLDPGEEEFPAKHRSRLLFLDEAGERVNRGKLTESIQARAPWFKGTIGAVHWSLTVPFARRLASAYGRGRCWLVGDAAHQTGPAGIQSLNEGIREAESLVDCVQAIVLENGTSELLEAYDRENRSVWHDLLGGAQLVRAPGKSPTWAFDHRAQILPCIPATGEALRIALRQLGLQFPGDGSRGSDSTAK